MFVKPIAISTVAAKRRSLVVEAWDNIIPGHGTNFANWEVSGGTSSVGSTGIVIDGISGNYARIKVLNATVGQTYWAYIRWDNRTSTAANIQVMGNGTGNGSAWGKSDGTAFTITTPAFPAVVPNYGERYFKIKCYANSTSDYLVLNHTGSSSGQTLRISEFKIFPPTSADFRVLGRGDQFGSVQGTTTSGIAKNNVDGVLAAISNWGVSLCLHDGDASDTSVSPTTWNGAIRDACSWGMMCCFGNHDGAYSNDSDWRSFMGYAGSNNDSNEQFPPASTNQYLHVFTLDNFNTLYKIGETRGAAMLTNVQNSTSRWKIFMSHYPTITSGTDQAQDGFLRSSAGWNWSTNGVCMVINGHNHQIERNLADSIVYTNLAKGGCDTHAWSTLESTSKVRIGGSGSTGYSGTLGVSGATAATGTGYLLMSITPQTMICEYWLTANENFLDPWTGSAPSITTTDATTHWLADRYKFEWQ